MSSANGTAGESETRARRAAVPLLLGLLLLLFLGRAFLPEQVLLPLDIVTQQWPPWQGAGTADQVHNPLLSDVVAYIYPVKTFAAEALRSGTFPLWNPYVLTGYPFTYNTQAGLFYPLSILYWLLPGPTAVDLTILLQLALGAWFMVLYLRALGLRETSVLAGSILFLFNGLMVVWMEWQVVHAAVIWLPLQLLLVEKLAAAVAAEDKARARVFAVGAAAAMALPWLGGHWNWNLYAALTGAVYLAARLAGLWRARPGSERIRRLLLYAAGIPLLALALSLVAVLPAALFLARSHRIALPFSESLRYGLLSRGAALLVPRFFGDPLTRTWWGFDNFNETTAYVGILALLLALLAPLLRRDWFTRFFTIWGALGLLWALGPLYAMLYVLPVFGGLLPSRAAFQAVFCATVLAALGLDALLDREAARGRWGRWAGGLVLLLPVILSVYLVFYREKVMQTAAYLLPQLGWFVFWLAAAALLLGLLWRGGVNRTLLGGAAVALLAAELIWFGLDINPVRPVSELYPPTNTTRFLQADPEPWRMVTPPQGLAYPPNSSLVPQLPNLSGYEPGVPATLLAYLNAAEGGDALRFERKLWPLAGLDSPLLDALNVKYIVTSAERWGEAQAVGVRPDVLSWAALPQETSLSGLAAGLQRIDLPLRGAGEKTLRVLSADGAYEFAHATAVPETNGWTSFFVDAFPGEWGDSFIFRVEGEGEVGLEATGMAIQPFVLSRPGLLYEDGKTRVYERPDYLPRAYVVPEATIAAGAAEALALVTVRTGALDGWVALELLGGPPPPGLDFANGEAALQAARVQITDSGLNDVAVQVEQSEPGFLVLADAYYPGWQALVDGETAPLYRANSVTRAVYL
ncbi:MAG: hypothetical protein ACK2UK_21870, partial [Candidatus Promineifilaceae bacterium]